MYIEYSEYKSMGGELDETQFSRHLYEAERVIDKFTTGIDNIRKLQIAFPTQQYDAVAVKHCIVELIDTVKAIADCNAIANGQGGALASVSSGAESKSFVTNTALVNASASEAEKQKYLYGIVKSYLSGVTDGNGINLLYGGAYVH